MKRTTKYILSTMIFIFLISACGQDTSNSKEANDDSKVVLDETGKLCGADLSEYQKGIDKLLAIGKKRSEGEDSIESLEEIKELNNKLKALGKKIETNPEIFKEKECAKVWIVSSTKYVNFIHENYPDFNLEE